MNLVMQFRKVCNHPELFERADVVAPFSFSEYGRAASIAREGNFVTFHYSTRSPIEFSIPKLFYVDGGLLYVPNEDTPSGPDKGAMRNLLNIWATDWIERSMEEYCKKLFFHSKYFSNSHMFLADSPFNFVPLLGMTSGEAHSLHFSPMIRRLAAAAALEDKYNEEDPFTK